MEHVGHCQFDWVAGVEAGLLLRDEGGDEAVLGCDSIDIYDLGWGLGQVWDNFSTEYKFTHVSKLQI